MKYEDDERDVEEAGREEEELSEECESDAVGMRSSSVRVKVPGVLSLYVREETYSVKYGLVEA